MTLTRAARVARAPNAALASVGIFWGGFAALVPDIKAGVGASEAAFGLAIMGSAAGGILSMSVAPRVMRCLGRHGLAVAASALLIAFFVLLVPKNPLGFAAAMLFAGASISLLDIGANMRLSVLEEREGLHLMNFSHAMFSFAFAGSAFVTSILRGAGYGPGTVLPWLALVNCALILMLWEGRGWRDADAAPPGADRQTPWVPILLAAGILFASFVIENATETWSALFIEKTLGAAPGTGGFGPVALGLTMGLGRLCGQIAAARLGETKLVAASALLGLLGALVTAAAPVPAVAIAGVGCLGVGVAVLVPSANSILGKLVRPDQRAHAISRAWMVGFTGFFLGPVAIGLIAQTSGLRVAYVVIALVAAAILPLVGALRRRGA